MILAVSGALRRGSATTELLRALSIEVKPRLALFDGLMAVQPFDGDDTPPPSLGTWRRAIDQARGIVFATPEYAHGMSGVLKNALDWLVGSGELDGKKVAIVSASSSADGGMRAQLQLAQTLSALNAVLVGSIAIADVRTKLDKRGELTDEVTRQRLRTLFDALEAVTQ